MAEQVRERQTKQRRRGTEGAQELPSSDPETAAARARREEETERILDEVDDLLAGINAEQFVSEYVQKGGE